jgi:hypothetical protein
MDETFYIAQFDTARDLIASNSPEATTGLYSILCALYSLTDMPEKNKKEFTNHQIHKEYEPAITCVYQAYYSIKQTDIYNNKVYTKPKAFMTLQKFKQKCFKEITIALQLILPNSGIQWRLIKP